MSLELKITAFLALIASIFGTYYGAYRHGISVESDRRDIIQLEERVQIGAAIDKASTENDQIKTKLQRDKANAQIDRDRARRELADFRLQLPEASCTYIPDTASRSLDEIARNGIRPNNTQAALNHFADGLKQDAYAQDAVIEECRVVMEWAKNLCKTNNSCQESN